MLSSKEHGGDRDGDGDDEEHEVLVEDISTLKGVVVTSDVRGSAPSQNHKGRKELKGGPGYYKGGPGYYKATILPAIGCEWIIPNQIPTGPVTQDKQKQGALPSTGLTC